MNFDDAETQIPKIKEAKLKGDDLLKAGQLTDALKHYYDAYLALRSISPDVKDEFAASLVSSRVKLGDKSKAELETLKKGVYGNMCIVYMKQEKWDRIVKFCQEILTGADGKPDTNPANIKHMYRLGLAKLRLNDLISARSWLGRVLEVEPTNQDARKLMAEVVAIQKQDGDKMRAQLNKMFSK